MSVPETPSGSDPPARPGPEQDPMAGGAPPRDGTPVPPAPRKRPWGWIAVAGVLAAGLIALGIYAMNLNSDLDDANAKIASQQQEIDQASTAGADVRASAKSAYEDLSARLGSLQADASQVVDQAAQQLDQAEQAAADAQGTADELQKRVAAAEAKAQSAATCAKSFVMAFEGVFSSADPEAGVEAAIEELKALQPQCAPALDLG